MLYPFLLRLIFFCFFSLGQSGRSSSHHTFFSFPSHSTSPLQHPHINNNGRYQRRRRAVHYLLLPDLRRQPRHSWSPLRTSDSLSACLYASTFLVPFFVTSIFARPFFLLPGIRTRKCVVYAQESVDTNSIENLLDSGRGENGPGCICFDSAHVLHHDLRLYKGIKPTLSHTYLVLFLTFVSLTCTQYNDSAPPLCCRLRVPRPWVLKPSSRSWP